MPTAPDERLAFLGRAWRAATAGCPEAISVLGALAGADAAARARVLRQGLVHAAHACHCAGLDVDAIEALAAHTAMSGELALGELVIPRGASGRTLTVRRAGTADELVRALLTRATPSEPVRLRWR